MSTHERYELTFFFQAEDGIRDLYVTGVQTCALPIFIAAFGAIGGIVNSAISGEFNYPRLDPAAKVWRPGWIGNVLVGAVAALVVWGVYGPLASYDLVTGTKIELHLTVAQLLTSLVVGLSGGKILTLMAEKQAATISKDQLAATLSALTKG